MRRDQLATGSASTNKELLEFLAPVQESLYFPKRKNPDIDLEEDDEPADN